MSSGARPTVAIVDYGMGNLFSVRQACAAAGLDAVITSSPADVRAAAGVIVPGVGAFGTAMRTLEESGMVDAIREVAASGRVLAGICLGMQLFMERSDEFGAHLGIGLIPGDVVRFPDRTSEGDVVKVPQIGWNRIRRPGGDGGRWDGTILDGLPDGEFLYFVHSYYVRPSSPDVTLAVTEYGGVEFCSALAYRNVMACQFHPERSSDAGLRIYRNLARAVERARAGDRL